MRGLTGSGLDVAAACPGAFALPVVVEEPGEAADRGTIIHEYLRTGDLPEGQYREDCLDIDYEKAVPFAEVLDLREACYAFLPSGDVEFMGYDLGRDYSQAPPNSIPITVDRAFLDTEDNLWVVDYKTGMEAPPATSLQLALGAYCVAKTMGAEAVKVAIVHLPPGRREPIWLVHEYDDLDLELIAHQVRNIIAAVDRARQKDVPDVHTGAHCKWCPAKRACPSTSALAQYVVAGMPDIATTVTSMTVEQVGEAWDKLTQAKSFVDELERELKRRVALEGEVPLPDGGTVAVGERTYKSVDPGLGQKVFEQLGIDPEPKVRYENGVVEAAAKAAGIKPAKLWKALAEGGALKIRTQETIQRKKAKE